MEAAAHRSCAAALGTSRTVLPASGTRSLRNPSQTPVWADLEGDWRQAAEVVGTAAAAAVFAEIATAAEVVAAVEPIA